MAEDAKKPAGARISTLIAATDPKSHAAESYRSLRTNIQLASVDGSHRSIVIASAGAGEGKTTTVANLGIVAAQAGSSVCLIDSDLRRPALHRLFGLNNTQGLTTSLVEDLPFVKLAQLTRVPNLSVLTSGPLPPTPGGLVGSRRMRDLLQAASADFDLLLFDTPPLITVSDGVALSVHCDGVILVIQVGSVPHEMIRRAAGQIEAVKGRILGVLLNRVDFRRDHYYADYGRYHRAYYGPEQTR